MHQPEAVRRILLTLFWQVLHYCYESINFIICLHITMNLLQFKTPIMFCKWVIPPLKPKYSFGKWWKWKISLMGIVHKSCMSSQSPCETFCSKPSIFVENCIKLTLSGCLREFSHRDMYIAPSSGHTSFNFNMPFKLILRSCEVVFWCLEWKYCTFLKGIDGNPFQFTKTILWL